MKGSLQDARIDGPLLPSLAVRQDTISELLHTQSAACAGSGRQEGVRNSIAVREFQSPVYLRQGPIVYRTTPEEIGFYEYHRWAADPRMLVTTAVIDHLRASGQFSMVSAYNGRPEVDYVLSGRLEKLEEVDYEGGVRVRGCSVRADHPRCDRCDGLEQCCF